MLKKLGDLGVLLGKLVDRTSSVLALVCLFRFLIRGGVRKARRIGDGLRLDWLAAGQTAGLESAVEECDGNATAAKIVVVEE